jgi:uncharacterized membrane protein
MKEKIKSYGFWTALAGAIVVLLSALGQIFGFSLDDQKVTALVMAIAGVLVVFGVVTMPKDEQTNDDGDDKKDDDEK